MVAQAALSSVALPVTKLASSRRTAVAGGSLRPVVFRTAAGQRLSRFSKVRSYQSSKDSEPADELQAKATELVEKAKAKWDETEEKPAVIAIAAVSFIAVWAASALVDGIDKLPLVGPFFEFVGLIVTSWFVYRYLLFGPDREELKKNIDSFFAKVSGKAGPTSTPPSVTPPKISKAEAPNGAAAEKLLQ